MSIKNITLVLILFTTLSISAQELLTVAKAIELALDNNYGIKVANNITRISENNTSILNTGYLPTLSTTGSAVYNRDNSEVEFRDGGSATLNGAESTRYNASLNLNYTIFDGLGRYYDYKRLKEEHQLSELEARETIENTIAQLFTVYYNVAQISENVKALQQTLDISRDRTVRAQYQFDYGQSTKLGVLNALVDINNDSINLINAKQQLKNTKRDLNVVLGNSFNSTFEVDTLVNFLFGLDKEVLYEKMMVNNVNMMQIEKNISINKFLIKASTSGFLPTLGLTGSYGWNKNNNNPAAFTATSTNTGISGGINLSWNLFDGGTNITRVKNAKINLENQEYVKAERISIIERDFNNSWDNYQNRLNIYRIQENNIITSQNNFDRTQEKFKLGQVNSIEFRQAQLNLLNAELDRNQAKYQAKLAELELLQISGELLNINF